MNNDFIMKSLRVTIDSHSKYLLDTCCVQNIQMFQSMKVSVDKLSSYFLDGKWHELIFDSKIMPSVSEIHSTRVQENLQIYTCGLFLLCLAMSKNHFCRIWTQNLNDTLEFLHKCSDLHNYKEKIQWLRDATQHFSL